jgi:Zn-dependent protease
VCAQPAPPDKSGILPDNTGVAAENPRPRRHGITPIQWVGLAALILLFLYQSGLLPAGDPASALSDFIDQLPFFIAIIAAVTIHEFSHALIATSFGDDLPRRSGRLTLNPLAHLDPMGSLLFLVAHFGWGKPVPINPNAMRNPNLGWALSSAAGPASNLISAAVVALLVVTLGRPGDAFLHELVRQFVGISVFLAIFNLIPLPPLDGFGFVFGLSPRPLKLALLPVQRFGPLILLALVILPNFSRSFPPVLQVVLAFGSNLFFTILGVPYSAL